MKKKIERMSIRFASTSDNGLGVFGIQVLIDPLSTNAPRITEFLYELYKQYSELFEIVIILNPQPSMKDDINKFGMPKHMNRYYRFVFNPSVSSNFGSGKHHALFVDMPKDQVLYPFMCFIAKLSCILFRPKYSVCDVFFCFEKKKKKKKQRKVTIT